MARTTKKKKATKLIGKDLDKVLKENLVSSTVTSARPFKEFSIGVKPESEKLRELGQKLGDTVYEKNIRYGSAYKSTAACMKILYPQGIKPGELQDATIIVRVLDKLARIANGHFDDSWSDIAGYGLIGTSLHEKKTT
jgi:hypothetical protein